MPSNDLTPAFSLQALERLTRPERAFEDAATWTSHIGVVSSEASFIEHRRVREAGYEWDFLSGPRSIEAALSSLLDHFEAERYVFVGVEETSEIVERVPHWIFQPVTEAAGAADWQLVATSAVDDDWP